MKRAATFGILAFFLILNSGMYVCAVHCSAAKLLAKPEMQMACHRCKKCCNSNRDNSCNKKHGSFTIKENIQPGFAIRMHMPLLTLLYTPGSLFNRDNTVRPNLASAINGKAPPGLPGNDLTIRHHSLLI